VKLHSIFSNFQLLRHLELRDVRFRSFSQIVEVLEACPILDHISFDVVSWANGCVALSPRSRSKRVPARLRTLELGACDKNVLLEWFLSGDRVPSVEKLCVREVLLNETLSIGTFLRALGLSLLHLELAFCTSTNLEGPFDFSLPVLHWSSNSNTTDAFRRDIDMANNKHLSVLQFHTVSECPAHRTWSAIPKLLSQISSHVMEEVSYTILLMPRAGRTDTDSFNWRAISKCFKQDSSSRQLHYCLGSTVQFDLEELQSFFWKKVQASSPITCRRLQVDVAQWW
jgi:hypothetical protein